MNKGTTSTSATTLNFAKWEFLKTLFSYQNYIAVFLSLCAAWLMVNGMINTVAQNGLIIEANPFMLPFLATLIPYAVFLALAVAVSLAREIEQRTFEVLFFAPIRFSSFVLGRFLGQLTYYLIALPLVLLFFIGYATSVNLRVGPGFLGAIVLSPLTVASVVGFGFLIAAYFRKTRVTVVVLLVVILVFLGVQFAHVLLPTLQPAEADTTLLVLTDVVDVMYRVVEWISPFAHLTKGVDAAQIGAPELYGQVVLVSLAYTIITLLLSVWVLREKGISR
jgi:ABC-type transport system involved in multi-copper enzyme maturation permease subunit